MNISMRLQTSTVRLNEMRPNNSLDASGGSVFLNLLGAAKGALIRAAASTQTLGIFFDARSIREWWFLPRYEVDGHCIRYPVPSSHHLVLRRIRLIAMDRADEL